MKTQKLFVLVLTNENSDTVFVLTNENLDIVFVLTNEKSDIAFFDLTYENSDIVCISLDNENSDTVIYIFNLCNENYCYHAFINYQFIEEFTIFPSFKRCQFSQFKQ